ncbi:electron transport complex protein RnfE [Lachnospiraceae bacterium A10]|nr:electron transport complex protein RnfE [Lachnospiraceae bacterium A10]
MNKFVERLYNGILKENPSFVLMLGMCPTLAVTTSAINGLGMGLSTTVVLTMSNLLISCLRHVIPDRVRMPAYIVVVASLVTIVQFLMQGFVPSLYESLGIYIPLIVVNCIILGRAESYASKNTPALSFFDGLGMGFGFSISLTVIGLVREILGAGTAFGTQLLPLADAANGTAGFTPISIFVMPPGAFMVLAVLVAVMNVVRKKMDEKGKPLAAPQGCLTGDCMGCSFSAGCTGKSVDKIASANKEEKED